MKNLCLITMLAGVMFCGATTLVAQETKLPKPGPEFDILKADVGTWDVEIRTWAGPGEPMVSKGKETNRMLGGFWLIVDFEGNMMGLDFKGHGVYSYDVKKKHYIGTWVDSMSSNKIDMVGRHDKDKKTVTYEGMAPGMDGQPAKHVLTTKYNDDGTRVMTMHIQAGEDMVKFFEMTYTKAKAVGR